MLSLISRNRLEAVTFLYVIGTALWVRGAVKIESPRTTIVTGTFVFVAGVYLAYRLLKAE